jgi:iron complex outermembrane recepter protein
MGIRQPISTNAMYQYLEDGIPIRPLGVFNHNALNEINLMGSDSVEVVKGAASSLYGSNAVGGAVNFISAAPSRTPYAHMGVRRDNTAGFVRYDTAASNTWGDLGLRFAHYSSRRESDNWQQYSGGSKDSFTLRGDYKLNANSMVRATWVHTDLDTQTSGSVFANDYFSNPGKSINTFSYRKDKTTRVNVAWEGETVQNGMTTVTLFARKNDHGQLPNYTIRNCGASSCSGTINNNHVDSTGLDIKHEQVFEWWASRLVTGVLLDKSQNPYFSNNLSITKDTTTGVYLSYSESSTQTGRRKYNTDIDNTGVFAQWEASPADHWRMVLGARSDSIRYRFNNELAPAGSDDYGARNETRKFSRVSPKLGTTYSLSPTAMLYGNLSQGFTPPEVSQLYGATGIPDLKPATYNNRELGWRQSFLGNKLNLDAAWYRLDGKDTIVSYTIGPGNSQNRNAGKTRSEGLELGLQYQSGAWDARLSTAVARHRYVQYKLGNTSDFSGKSMPQAPRDVSNMEIGFRPLDNTRIALELVHQGSYWMNNANTQRYPGHTLVNLRGHVKAGPGFELWGQIRNLTNRRYADSATSSYSGTGTHTPNTQDQYTPGTPFSLMVGMSYTWGAP